MLHAHAHPHPDANRIAGYTVAIGFNALLLMLLLVPMQGASPLKLPGESQPTITWYMPRQQQPTPPLPAPVIPSRPQPAAATVSSRTPVAPTPDPVLVDQGSEQAIPLAQPETTTQATSIATPSQPLPGVRLEYAQAPAPAYPRAALHARIEGTVLLEVLVDVDGRPLRVEVRQGSGDRRLDAAAREQVLAHWRFRPAIRDGRAVQAIGLVPINFRLAASPL
jgi:protein TonB